MSWPPLSLNNTFFQSVANNYYFNGYENGGKKINGRIFSYFVKLAFASKFLKQRIPHPVKL